ncbi:farnesyl pyrophosphate synthase [Culicoides brevitarsis]|uniref:farnesyl pyrophosphate synthase n=1 Tax=Culicoides brevitarsis TaxID=469753 RepID=UPI00307B1D9A
MLRQVFQRALAQPGRVLTANSSVFGVNQQRGITKSPEKNEMAVDYLTFREQVSPMVKDKKYNMKKAQRAMTTHINYSVPHAINTTVVPKEDLMAFDTVWPDIVRDLDAFVKKNDINMLAQNWITRALQYNVPRGKKNRGLATLVAYKMLSTDYSEEQIRLAHVLGWCVEMLQAVFLIQDDIMDGSPMRRGQPSWHTVQDVGLTAINDSTMIEAGIFHILEKHFADKPYYQYIVKLFHDVIFITTIGQSLDIQTSKQNVLDFTMEKYKAIVRNKTSYYTFYLPVALAMTMTGWNDPEVFRQSRTILLEIGQFFQIQDDFLDVYGDPSVTGKVGTDIQDNKCSWLAVVCNQRASPQQKDILKECYGSSNPEKVETVKKLYNELGLPTVYTIYEEDSYQIISTHIQQTSRGLPHDIFLKIMEKIYRRES